MANDHLMNWSKGTKGYLKQCRQAPKTQQQLFKKAQQLSLKYYKTEDLTQLQPYQLDKVISWTTNHSPDRGKSKSRKAEMKMRQNKKYKNSRRQEHNDHTLKGT